ncbi:hypothetical protein [Desulfosporosinus sp. SB140]|uniref:hypothetical protein n=1 Tax=Desulfosporosinus paludis TaxID=3115649 RepID=UPI00388CF9C5
MPTTLDANSSNDKAIPSVPVTPEDTNTKNPTLSQKFAESDNKTKSTSIEKSNTLSISKAKYNQLKYRET